jgi:hypothetical protein
MITSVRFIQYNVFGLALLVQRRLWREFPPSVDREQPVELTKTQIDVSDNVCSSVGDTRMAACKRILDVQNSPSVMILMKTFVSLVLSDVCPPLLRHCQMKLWFYISLMHKNAPGFSHQNNVNFSNPVCLSMLREIFEHFTTFCIFRKAEWSRKLERREKKCFPPSWSRWCTDIFFWNTNPELLGVQEIIDVNHKTESQAQEPWAT